MSTVRVRLLAANILQYTRAPNGPVGLMVRNVARRIVNNAKRRAPVQEGTLRASIHDEFFQGPLGPGALIGSELDYAIYVEKGTGIYAGRGLIRPKRAKALRFRVRGGPIVFAAYVRGQRAQPYLVPALRDVISSL